MVTALVMRYCRSVLPGVRVRVRVRVRARVRVRVKDWN